MIKYPVTYLVFVFWMAGAMAFSQGYNIQVELKDFPGDQVILGHHFNTSMIPKDTARLDQKGRGQFTGKDPLPQGLYIVYLPNRKYFDLIVGDDQFFSLKNDTVDMIRNFVVSGSDENRGFYDYQSFIQENKARAGELHNSSRDASGKKDSAAIKKQIARINDDVKEKTKQIIHEYKGTFLSTFLSALREIEVPEPPGDENGNITDSLFQYKYYKKHYFDHFDISDPRLLRTPVYGNKITRYIGKVVPQIPDSLISAADMLIERSRSDPRLFRFMLVTLFNHFAKSKIMGMDAVYVHLAEKYYIPEADWSNQEFIEKLKERVKKLKPTLIGQTAPDIRLVEIPDEHFINARENGEIKKDVYAGNFFNLHDVQANYLILYFWEYDCGHCKKSTPKLMDIYQEMKVNGLEVVAVHMLGGEEGKEKWVDFVNKHELYGWINCWNPYDYSYKIKYDINSTPVLFLLDKDKRIIAKKVDPEQAKKIIEDHTRREKLASKP